MSYYVCLMGKEDIAQVTDIEREAFPNEWPSTNFQYELKNQIAHYLVVCENGRTIELPESDPGIVSWVKQLFNRSPSPQLVRPYIVGFAGLWTMAEEAHITAIAVRQSYRRYGIGELLMISLVDLAKELKTSLLTLEVRASNKVAQNLYVKYGFKQVGIRRGYYSNNREDAILMTTDDITSTPFHTHLQELRNKLLSRIGQSERTPLFYRQPYPIDIEKECTKGD